MLLSIPFPPPPPKEREKERAHTLREQYALSHLEANKLWHSEKKRGCLPFFSFLLFFFF